MFHTFTLFGIPTRGPVLVNTDHIVDIQPMNLAKEDAGTVFLMTPVRADKSYRIHVAETYSVVASRLEHYGAGASRFEPATETQS